MMFSVPSTCRARATLDIGRVRRSMARSFFVHWMTIVLQPSKILPSHAVICLHQCLYDIHLRVSFIFRPRRSRQADARSPPPPHFYGERTATENQPLFGREGWRYFPCGLHHKLPQLLLLIFEVYCWVLNQASQERWCVQDLVIVCCC